MTISYNWLCDYLQTTLSAADIAQIFTSIGLEVEHCRAQDAVKGGLRGVAVGRVLTCTPHPNSDHMHVTAVDAGGAEPLQIVCGAPNVAAGQKVAVAAVGATLYFADGSEVKIKKAKLRGIESCGMICAPDELGLGADHNGIMTLPPDAPVGAPLADYLNLQGDVVLEIGLTPNRIDAASHIGAARDAAAYLAVHSPQDLLRFTIPSVKSFSIDNNSLPFSVKIDNPLACIRYSGITIAGVRAGASPEWMQKKLTAIGIRPINNVVDVTNFVLHETGQPLHAFDADRVEGNSIVVRACAEGTPFRTLDGIDRRLSAHDLMICSAERPLCIAGVFGGIDSGVTETTTRIFLESACFAPQWVRASARRHGLSTDASFRYERGADPNITIYALKRAAMLIKDLAGGAISSDIVDIYPKFVEKQRIVLAYDYLNATAGKEILPNICKKVLTALEYGIESEDDASLCLNVPTYRTDVRLPCDAAEDILRIYGYDNIEIPSLVRFPLPSSPPASNERLMNAASDFLSHNGFNEIMTLSFNKSAHYCDLPACPPHALVMLKNPHSADLDAMRQTLLFGGLEAAAHNIRRRQPNLRLYELGSVYCLASPDGSAVEHYGEQRHLALLITGMEQEKNWNNAPQPSSFFTLKGVVERLLAQFNIDLASLPASAPAGGVFADGIACKLMGEPFLEAGIVSQNLCKLFDIKQEVYYAQMRWGVLTAYADRQQTLCAPLPKYPEVRRDLALLLDRGVSFELLRRAAFKSERQRLRSVSLVDVYEGGALPEGKKSYALSFVLQDSGKTLTDSEIDAIMQGLVSAFAREFESALR